MHCREACLRGRPARRVCNWHMRQGVGLVLVWGHSLGYGQGCTTRSRRHTPGSRRVRVAAEVSELNDARAAGH